MGEQLYDVVGHAGAYALSVDEADLHPSSVGP
jgi:hypothetical protein